MTVPTLYHFTCEHGRAALGERGVAKPLHCLMQLRLQSMTRVAPGRRRCKKQQARVRRQLGACQELRMVQANFARRESGRRTARVLPNRCRRAVRGDVKRSAVGRQIRSLVRHEQPIGVQVVGAGYAAGRQIETAGG